MGIYLPQQLPQQQGSASERAHANANARSGFSPFANHHPRPHYIPLFLSALFHPTCTCSHSQEHRSQYRYQYHDHDHVKRSINMAPSKYITLVSADDFEYVLPREACYASPMLKRTIDPNGGFLESRTGVVRMEDMRLVVFLPVFSSCTLHSHTLGAAPTPAPPSHLSLFLSLFSVDEEKEFSFRFISLQSHQRSVLGEGPTTLDLRYSVTTLSQSLIRIIGVCIRQLTPLPVLSSLRRLSSTYSIGIDTRTRRMSQTWRFQSTCVSSC